MDASESLYYHALSPGLEPSHKSVADSLLIVLNSDISRNALPIEPRDSPKGQVGNYIDIGVPTSRMYEHGRMVETLVK